MSKEINDKVILELVSKEIFLLDSSAIIRFEEIFRISSINVFEEVLESSRVHYLVSNDVFRELLNGPRYIDLMKLFSDRVINSEQSTNGEKENRFLIEKDGQVYFTELNKISMTDYGQILLCQNHSELILVANDQKMMKSAGALIGDRVVDINKFLNSLIIAHKDNKNLKQASKVIEKHYKSKRII